MVRVTVIETYLDFANDRLGPDNSDEHQLHFCYVVLPISGSNGYHSR